MNDDLVAKLRMEEARLRKCAPPYSPPTTNAKPSARAVDVDATLRREGFVLLDSREGRGLAAELAAAGDDRYPGGVAWIFLRSGTTKDACADIVDAFALPCSASPRAPFVGKDGAFSTIWRGLSARPRALIVLEGWAAWSHEADWKRPDCADVIAVADDESTDFLEETAPAVNGAERRLLALLCALDTSIVPTILLERIVRALRPADGAMPIPATDLNEVLGSLRERGLLSLTADGEALFVGRARATCRARLDADVQDIEATAAVLNELLTATPHDCVHVLRRLGVHAWHLLWVAPGHGATGRSIEPLTKTLCGREYRLLYADTARRWLARVRSEEPEPSARTLAALMMLAGCLRDRRELVEAQEVLREALALGEKIHGDASMELLPILGLLENVLGLGLCGDATDEQLVLNERSLAICEKHSPTAPGLAHMYWSYGLDLAVREEHARALPQFERAMAIAVPEDGFRVHYPLAAATTLAELGKPEDGVELVAKSLAMMRESDPSPASIALDSARYILSKHPHLLSRFHDIVSDVLQWSHWTKPEAEADDLARVRTHMVFALASQGRRSEAAQLAQEALAVLEPLHGSDSRWIKELRAILA